VTPVAGAGSIRHRTLRAGSGLCRVDRSAAVCSVLEPAKVVDLALARFLERLPGQTDNQSCRGAAGPYRCAADSGDRN